MTQLAISALEDLKAQDLKVLDVRSQTTLTDTMVVCTGTSSRHVKALAGNLVTSAKHAGFQPGGVEGMEVGEWVLVNLGEVVVHIMQVQTRAFFQLEKLWEMQPPPEAAITEPKPKKAKSARKAAAKKSAAKPASKAAQRKGAAKKAPRSRRS
ncbi:MAG TPA: ribosome silencing factor [Nevskiaceae bacterium]|nr:ribosome silencing factor [Nevskiaceae bacterium]